MGMMGGWADDQYTVLNIITTADRIQDNTGSILRTGGLLQRQIPKRQSNAY